VHFPSLIGASDTLEVIEVFPEANEPPSDLSCLVACIEREVVANDEERVAYNRGVRYEHTSGSITRKPSEMRLPRVRAARANTSENLDLVC